MPIFQEQTLTLRSALNVVLSKELPAPVGMAGECGEREHRLLWYRLRSRPRAWRRGGSVEAAAHIAPHGATLALGVMVGYQILAEATMVVHFGYLAYVVAGGFLAWRWPRTVWLHLAATGWGSAAILLGLACPLTYLEDRFREHAGQPGLPAAGFIDHYLEGVLYPQHYTALVQTLVAAAVVGSWAGLLWRTRHTGRRRRPVGSR